MTVSKPAVKSPAKTARPAAKVAPKTSAKPVVKPRAKTASASATTQVKKPVKVAKIKVVRDTFNMPQDDYARIATLKKSCLTAGVRIKKSELLRAGLQLLGKLSPAELKKAIIAVQTGKA